jgi:hypothetical protein
MALMMKASLLLAALVLCCRASFIPELPEPVPQPEPQPGSPVIKPPVNTGSCPKDVRRVECPMNPCLLLSCPAVRKAKCVVDSCGRCRPRWIYCGKEVTNDCLESLMACPDGSVPHQCRVDPCLTARCPAVERAVCVADYCGGCRDRWILGDMEVTKRCHQGLAASASAGNGPCISWRCPIRPQAMCNDFVDHHQWFLYGGEDVTELCDHSLANNRLDAAASFQNRCQPVVCHIQGATCLSNEGRRGWWMWTPRGEKEVTPWC